MVESKKLSKKSATVISIVIIVFIIIYAINAAIIPLFNNEDNPNITFFTTSSYITGDYGEYDIKNEFEQGDIIYIYYEFSNITHDKKFNIFEKITVTFEGEEKHITSYDGEEINTNSTTFFEVYQFSTNDTWEAGEYKIEIYLRDDITKKSTQVMTKFTLNIINIKPVAIASSNVVNGMVPLTVQFNGSGLDKDGYITSYHWDFGDGNSSSLRNTTYTFQNAGIFTVKLTVTDNKSKNGTGKIDIEVYSKEPTAIISAYPIEGITPLQVQFNGSGVDHDGEIVSYFWEFGDDNTSTQQNPIHTFNIRDNVLAPNPDIFLVNLTVTDNEGYTGRTTFADLITVNHFQMEIIDYTRQEINLSVDVFIETTFPFFTHRSYFLLLTNESMVSPYSMSIEEYTRVTDTVTITLDFIIPYSDLLLSILYIDQGSGLDPHVSLSADFPFEDLI